MVGLVRSNSDRGHEQSFGRPCRFLFQSIHVSRFQDPQLVLGKPKATPLRQHRGRKQVKRGHTIFGAHKSLGRLSNSLSHWKHSPYCYIIPRAVATDSYVSVFLSTDWLRHHHAAFIVLRKDSPTALSHIEPASRWRWWLLVALHHHRRHTRDVRLQDLVFRSGESNVVLRVQEPIVAKRYTRPGSTKFSDFDVLSLSLV